MSGLELSDGVVIENNTAQLRGGAIGAQEGFTIAISGVASAVRIVNNSADYAGGIIVYTSPNVSIVGNVTFADNVAYGEGDGGALYMRCMCEPTPSYHKHAPTLIHNHENNVCEHMYASTPARPPAETDKCTQANIRTVSYLPLLLP